MKDYTPQQLIDFENDIAAHFEKGEIRAPVHLSGGNEVQLIEIFKRIKNFDWVFSTHRSHYHALLKGCDPAWVKKEILDGNSIHLMSVENRFVTSAIVGGCLPMAVGVAMGMKRQGSTNHVWVFVGDMAATTGLFHECVTYAARHSLPITFVIEDNGMSTNTPTEFTWGTDGRRPDIIRYRYERTRPHINIGKWVIFQ